MAKASFQKRENVELTKSFLSQRLPSLGLTMELINQAAHKIDDKSVYLFVYEKFYWRSSNRTSLTIMITGDIDESYVDVISSGGGQGVLFKFSWGAEKSFVNQVRNLLINHGFTEV
ncbi:MAG: hypothetical protein JXB08_01285 [Bacilli bacterium]|nr:hypothetical protein [Bacilli bacterium]MBN2876676.1 hypothetical protein [Bacilli bacterium]